MTVREICLMLLLDYEASGKYVNLSMSSHLTDNLSSDDRRLLTSLLYTTVEHKITYDYYITAISKRGISDISERTLGILRMGMCQLLDMASIPDHAAVDTSVKLAKHSGERSFVNGVLRQTARLKSSGDLPLPKREKSAARYLSVRYSFPLWISKHFISLYGEEATERLYEYYNTVRYTDLTVNINKISREAFAEKLKEQGYALKLHTSSRLSIRLESSVNPRTLYGFDEGLFFVQDLASAISAEAIGTAEGDRVLDLCAAPGGKTFATAILAGDGGHVTSTELHVTKIPLIEEGVERLGFSNVTVSAHDAQTPKDEYNERFDRVICDVPCSGLGVLAKKPDIRYKDNQSLQELNKIQHDILWNASEFVKKGGYLLYSTCTLNPDENERIVEEFLSLHDDFALCDFEVGDKASKGGMLTLMPYIDLCDGFFMAKMRKVK